MKVGILGTGVVGTALGRGFIALGHEVKLGGREANNPKAVAWAKESGTKASAGAFADVASFGEVLVLATLGSATESALKQAGVESFKGKLVIDTTNPLDFSTGKPQLSMGHTTSLGELVQRTLPGAKVVKAFNTVGNAHMFKPTFPGGPPTMFVGGNDAGAKKQLEGILKDFGWEMADLGGIEASRWLEPMCMAWVAYAMVNGGTWNHAFKLLKK
ncbi:MAG: NADPH-dependent F420 reductase [Myxococcaceae bacterium]